MAQGDLNVDAPEVVLSSSPDSYGLAVALSSLAGHWNLLRATQILAGERLRGVDDRLYGTFSYDMSAVLSGARPEIDDVIGGTHYRLIMLDDQHRVSYVAQVLESADKTVVVRGMKSYGRLVAHVQDAHQTRPDLRGKSDSLGLTAAQCRSSSGEREVVQTYVQEESQPGFDLLQNLLRNGFFSVGQKVFRAGTVDRGGIPRDDIDPFQRLRYGPVGHAGDVRSGYGDCPRLGPELLPTAVGARPSRHVSFDLLTDVVGLGLHIPTLKVVQNALKARVPAVSTSTLSAVGDANPLSACTAKQRV